MFLKKVYKKKIIITGKTGLLGSTFFNKYKNKYNIVAYPHRIEKINKFTNWLGKKNFHIFIHFAGITNVKKNNNNEYLNKINTISSINLLKALTKKKIPFLDYFLFISSSHVYGYSNKKIKETKKTCPISPYGRSKKKVEDFIFNFRKNFNFKVGVARVFNFTGKNQKKGHFIPDIFYKVKSHKQINKINQFRDFIHIDDVCKALDLILKNKIEKPINVSSGKKINLIKIAKIANNKISNKPAIFGKKRGGDIFGDNKFLRSLGLRKFKNINQIINSYK